MKYMVFWIVVLVTLVLLEPKETGDKVRVFIDAVSGTPNKGSTP